ncbi:MAG: GntR family transcriptional regulator [Rhizobiaceae bacterium]
MRSTRGSPPTIPSGAALQTRSGATERVVDALREAIVTLELKPGAFLDKAALTGRFGVSRFPVSEALNRLKAEGLVDIRPQSGSTVSLLRLADARENMFLRRALETEAVAHHATSPSPELIADLKRSLRSQKVALDAEDRPGFHRLDLEFHDILVSAVGYRRVRQTVEWARLALDRARRLIISPRRHQLSYAEHASIVTAIASGDSLVARRAMAAHLDSVLAELEAFAFDNPQVFADVTGRQDRSAP